MSCVHSPLRKDVEIWLIDESELVLYRRITGEREQIIPIKDNRSMHRFMCVSEEEFYELVEREDK